MSTVELIVIAGQLGSTDFRLVDGDLVSILAVGLKQVLQPVKPVSDRLVRAVNERFDLPVG